MITKVSFIFVLSTVEAVKGRQLPFRSKTLLASSTSPFLYTTQERSLDYNVPYAEEHLRPYTFQYGVQDHYSGANFGHSEKSDGNAVKGSYTVALPDGRIQKVTYVADEQNGFQAEVSYEGEAKYPEYSPTSKALLQQQSQPAVYRPTQKPSLLSGIFI